MIVRWRFAHVRAVTVNGAPVKLEGNSSEPFVEFDHTQQSTIAWQ